MGNALAELRMFEEAIACYQRTIDIDPKFPNAYHSMGVAHYKLGMLEDAL
jgi:tetratricopeptide (TPR) repeat protein